MAKILILTFILCVAYATFAETSVSTREALLLVTEPQTSTPATPATEPQTSTPATPATEPQTSTPATPATEPQTSTPATPATEPQTSTPATPATVPQTSTPATPATEPQTSTPATPASTATEPSTEGTPQTEVPVTEGSSVSPDTGSPPTEDPNTPSTAPVPSSQAPTDPPSACASNPCLGGSTCEERANHTFVCLCLTGDFYSGACVRAKVFPGKLSLKETFKPEMSNKQSQEFKDTSEKIIKAIEEKFKGTQNGYNGSLVLELRKSQQSKTRAEAGNVEASIEIIYHPNADIKEEDVLETMKTVTCDECSLPGTFAAQNLCDSGSCDDITTTCNSTEGTFTCSCQEGFASTTFSDRICVECPDGERYDTTDNKCLPCGFGYNGFNCKDNRVLILVIVAPILGALLIIALILLGVLTTKSKKKSSKIEDEDIGKPYHSHSVAKAPLSKSDSNGYPPPVKELTNGLAVSSGAPRIPRATATGNWESKTNLEMTPSNSRQNLISSGQNSRFDDNQDDMISFAHSRPKNNPYEQIRPTSNPYAQNRSMNPYAQSRGQTNPYYS